MVHNATPWSKNGDLKLRRANELVLTYIREVEDFHRPPPCRVERIAAPSPEEERLIVRIDRHPPPRWGAIAGDAIHNLRAVLDLLIWRLVLVNGANPTGNYFPIRDTEADFRRCQARALRGVSGSAKELVRTVAPYESGNRTLWLLHKLDIVDKHQVLLPVHSSVWATNVYRDPENEAPRAGEQIRWDEPLCPVVDGSELPRPKDVDLDRHKLGFEFTIALDPEIGLVEKGLPLGKVLVDLLNETRRVLELFPEATSDD